MKRLDQFFTNNNVVDKCLSTIEPSVYDMVIEPSAGFGSFYHKIEHKNKMLEFKLIEAQRELQIEFATNTNLAKELVKVQDENLKAKEDLLFYKKMMGK